MPTFPDHGAKEESIRTVGRAELLRKRGELILRVDRGRWGTERERWRYQYLAPYARGRVLHAGLGMGISAEELLLVRDITELVCFEIVEDVVRVYETEHASDRRLTIEVADAHASKPTSMFDLVLYELPMDSEAEYDKSKAYLTWAWSKLNPGGHFVMPHNRYSVALIAEFTQLSWTVLSAQYMAPGVKVSLKPKPIWIVVAK